MKAITVTQPWATLIAIGAKRFETRSWGVGYTGPLAIHAAQGLDGIFKGAKTEDLEDVCMAEPFRETLTAEFGLGFDVRHDLPRGKVVAVVDLMRCTTMTEEAIARVAEPERSFGFYEPGRVAWVLDEVQRLREPVGARGRQQLWHPSADELQRIGWSIP